MSTQDAMKTYNDLTNQNVERMNALGELNLKVAERMASRQMDVMSLFMEQGVRMMKLATEAKGYSELYKGQVDMAREMSEKLMAESKTTMAMAGEIRDDYRGWLDAAMADIKEGNSAVRNAVTA
ncbi:phasin family protein [uncultured Thiohalocapsa sp.]|uniref:phasin family protein n=1 Tax=uncultured Thiohalocapsa sp. TaxID=768990 RepID=UPI0025EEA80D|nr:phasin family protein [uncultured Thiohalocapsa sp.]